MRYVDKRFVCNWHPHFIAPETLDKQPWKTFGTKPLPQARPFAPQDTYDAAESEILAWVCSYAPALSVDLTSGYPSKSSQGSPLSAAWTVIYLDSLIQENKRPAAWLVRAKSKMRELADWLTNNQKGGPAVSGYSSANIEWGAYLTHGTEYMSEESGAAGLALMKAYALFGTPIYLDAATACAWFLRTAQCGDKLANFPSSTDASGTSAKHWGAWTNAIASATHQFDHRYYPKSLVGLEFLRAYMVVSGNIVIGSSVTDAEITASRQIVVGDAISEAERFWLNPQWSVSDNAAIKGFSTTTPREYFDSYPQDKGAYIGTGSWLYDATGVGVTAWSWGIGARAIGNSSDICSYFTGFANNESYHLPPTTHNRMVSGYDERMIWSTLEGNYDAKKAPATSMRVTGAGSPENGSAIYDIAALGLMASAYSSAQRPSFAQIKNDLNLRRPRGRDGTNEDRLPSIYLGWLGRCGLSYQPYTSAAFSRISQPEFAAATGLIYREAPKAFMGK